MRYAVVDLDNTVINVIEWDGVTAYDVNKGHGKTGLLLVQSDTANSGHIYHPDTNTFTNPDAGE